MEETPAMNPETIAEELNRVLRDIPDFPKPGILFKDITPLLSNPTAFQRVTNELVERCRNLGVEAIVGIESRGFLFGVPVALALGVPFIPARKPGKLPADVHQVEYALEYGTDTIEMHQDALSPGQKVAVVDDLIATGGSAAAAGELVRKCGAEVAAYLFVIELSFLRGREKLDADCDALLVV